MALVCSVCDSPEVIAAKPGVEGEMLRSKVGRVIASLRRPVPDEAWCLACWPCRPPRRDDCNGPPGVA